jgi:hypothetical protein
MRTTVLSLLPVLVATLIGPAPAPLPSLVPYDLARLTDAGARRLVGRQSLFRLVLDCEPDGDAHSGWRCDSRGEGPRRHLKDATAGGGWSGTRTGEGSP